MRVVGEIDRPADHLPKRDGACGKIGMLNIWFKYTQLWPCPLLNSLPPPRSEYGPRSKDQLETVFFVIINCLALMRLFDGLSYLRHLWKSPPPEEPEEPSDLDLLEARLRTNQFDFLLASLRDHPLRLRANSRKVAATIVGLTHRWVLFSAVGPLG